MAENRNRVVIFDLGNVVLDWNVERIIDSLGFDDGTLDLLRAELFAHSDWIDMDHGKKSEAAVVADICGRSSLRKDTVEQALLAAKKSLAPIAESLSLMHEIASGGLEMFCLSNMSRETYDHIRDYELFEMFSGIVISGIEGRIKPNEDIFHLTLDRFGLEPRDTLFIDDSIANIETAESLGINGFHFKRSSDCYSGIRELLF